MKKSSSRRRPRPRPNAKRSRSRSAKRRDRPRLRVHARDVLGFVDQALGEDLHAKRILSLSKATTGVIHSASLGVSAIGRALALAQKTDPKHGIKQVDRLLSNVAIDPQELFASWVPFVLSSRTEARIALDWTHFERDGHATLAAYLLTTHGRATPLVWRTFPVSELTDGGRNDAEDVLLLRLREVLPAGVSVTLVADRGFGGVELYKLLDEWGWKYVIRFRKGVLVTSAKGETKPVEEWVSPKGHAKALVHARVTTEQYTVGAVVSIHAKGMKDAWFLATNLEGQNARDIVNLYARRFTIEETFRDQKNPRFGLGMNHTRAKTPERRDRLLLLAALAQALLTLLGAAGERCGIDRYLKANTSKKRTMSLFSQGCYWFQAIDGMKTERLRMLMTAFGEIIHEHQAISKALGVI
jgi:hypothetical protein